MNDTDPSTIPNGQGSDKNLVLRAKYLEYCSAQIAEHLLLLSPDEIYMLAEESNRMDAGGSELTYERMVSLATIVVSKNLPLPSFNIWVEDYMRDPDKYEDQFLGLWESEV